MTIAVIGTGLIGGSMALALKDLKIAEKVVGVDTSKEHLEKALELGIIDETADLDQAVEQSDLVIVAIPVHSTEELLPRIMDHVNRQVVMDVSSTKAPILNAIRDHPRRSRFVGTHPMWGTEYSGPEAAVRDAFIGKVTVFQARKVQTGMRWNLWRTFIANLECVLYIWTRQRTTYMRLM